MKLNPAKCIFGIDLKNFLGFIVSQSGIEADIEKIKTIREMKLLITLARRKG